MKGVKTIVFDYDGTIHNSTKIYVDVFRRVYREMVAAKDAPEQEFTDADITKWLGYSVKDMWDTFMPELSSRKKTLYAGEIGRLMTEKIQNKEAVLYEGALETLQYLKGRGYHVLYLSNCGRPYMDMHAECFGLRNYFDYMYCTGDYDQKPKYEIYNVIKEQYPPEYLVVGDRFHDMEVARYHKVYTAGCAYGFGTRKEIEAADIILEDIRDLKKLL